MLYAAGIMSHMFFQLCTVMILLTVVSVASQNAGQLQELLRSGNITGMIPSTPHPANVNCYVEVQLMETVGGQCVRFGRSRMWSCQSGIHMELSHECERQNRRRDRTNR